MFSELSHTLSPTLYLGIVKPGHVVSCLDQCGPCLVGCSSHPGCEIVQGFESGLTNGFKSKLWVLTGVEHEWGGLSRSVDAVVIGRLGNLNPVIPVVLSLVHKEAKELLNFLVNVLGLAVCLRVVSCGCCDFNSEYLAETSHEVQHKLGPSVANHLFRESM